LSKTSSVFKNITNPELNNNENQGLVYSNALIGDLVNMDTDGDGVLDWEESLWGTDPTKRNTNDDGTSDFVEIEKLKAAQGISEPTWSEQNNENLTETDKFSREFFSTVVALNQAGVIDAATVDKLGSTLADEVSNSVPRKVFAIKDFKTSGDDKNSIQIYGNALASIFNKHAININAGDILEEAITEDGEIDVEVLNKLDPIIKNFNGIINEMSKINVPPYFLSVHLQTINGLEKIAENLADIKLIDKDPLAAMSAMSQYPKNNEELQSYIDTLNQKGVEKLGN